jgi:Holliday junction resolvasome RuvABC endonuclease subunit
MAVVVGIDVSLTSTGIAVADAGRIVHTRAIRTKALPKEQKADLGAICRRILSVLDAVQGTVLAYRPALVVIEAPSHGSRFGSPHERSGLWWLIVSWLEDRATDVAQVAPTARAKYGTGRGNADKEQVHKAVQTNYGTDDLPIKTNDEADAVLLAAMGARHLGQPVEGWLPTGAIDAMDKVVWP